MCLFESSVILEGSKTYINYSMNGIEFESSVILEGSKTHHYGYNDGFTFESSVILEGSKTFPVLPRSAKCLRVVLF